MIKSPAIFRRTSDTSQKPKKLACRTIRDLVYAQICYVRFIFKFSNRYRVTPKINELYQGKVDVIFTASGLTSVHLLYRDSAIIKSIQLKII